MASSQCEVSSCCICNICNESFPVDTLVQHFMHTTCENAEVSSVICKEEPSEDWEESQHCQETSASNVAGYIDFKSICVMEDFCCSCNAAAVLNSGFLKGSPVVLGNRKLKLFSDVQLIICDMSALSKVKVFVNAMANVHGSGVATPYLYVWPYHSSYVWHLHDCCVEGSDQTYHSCMKVWFFIPKNCLSLFHCYVSHHLKLHMGSAACRTFLSSDYTGVTKGDIQITVVTQDRQELKMLCHSGCTLGPSIFDAAPYAMEVRFTPNQSDPQEQQAGQSVTRSHSASADLWRQLIGKVTGTECSASPNDYKEVHTPTASRITSDSVLPSQLMQDADTMLCDSPECPETELSQHTGGDAGLNCETSRTTQQTLKRHEVRSMMLIQCPKCDKTFKGSRDRLLRLLVHATKCHKSIKKKVVSDIIDRYYPLMKPLLRDLK